MLYGWSHIIVAIFCQPPSEKDIGSLGGKGFVFFIETAVAFVIDGVVGLNARIPLGTVLFEYYSMRASGNAVSKLIIFFAMSTPYVPLLGESSVFISLKPQALYTIIV